MNLKTKLNEYKRDRIAFEQISSENYQQEIDLLKMLIESYED